MAHYALIGNPLGHSYSQRWFEALFAREGLVSYSYRLHEMATLDGLRRWVTDECIDGFNVTIPYKQAILPLLDTLTPEAAAIGAVNCVVVDGGRLVGHNTDAPAFAKELGAADGALCTSCRALILGTGGAARAVAYALKGLGIGYRLVSRKGHMHDTSGDDVIIGYSLDEITDFGATLLVNATPVGTWPDVYASPWPWPEALDRFRLVYDLTYNPSPTLLLRQAAAAGAATKDGLGMLYRQAELSWRLWRQR